VGNTTGSHRPNREISGKGDMRASRRKLIRLSAPARQCRLGHRIVPISTAVIRILVDVVAVQDILLSNEAFDRKERDRQRGEQHNKNQWRHFFAFSPSSTKRRMASERPSSSSCMAAQASTFARSSSDRRIAVTGSRPVAGRPRPFFGTTLFDLGIKCITINASRGEVLSFRPGSNPNHPE
jgi:hypothetical protein